jgi:hypothetical protein
MPAKEWSPQRPSQGRMVTLFDVRRLERYAWHATLDGHLYEYEKSRFWHTNLIADEPAREALEDESRMPLGPWYHLQGCDCELCGG